MLTIFSQSNSMLQPLFLWIILKQKWQHIKPYNNIITVKDKAEVLMQVDQLTQVKDELTEQVKSPWQLLVLNIVSNLRRSKYTRTSLIGYNLLFDLQVAELTAELEKERSKVHSLKSEVDKFKVIRFCLSKKI